ncbi:MAG: YceI family protein [Gemmatimonadetes bacterium]|nr:YceI family protein [Gemmatimonadota bacterium]
MPWILTSLICLPLAVRAGEWQVDNKAPDNHVKFTSRVTAFTFSGVTDQIDGFVYWEGDSLFARKSQFRFEVNLAGFDTGIGKRDRDMREVLDTEKWPRAVYKGVIAEHAAVDSTVAAYRVETRGTLSLHGVDRAIEVPGTVVLEEGRSRIEAAFTLKLADYEIEAPSLAAFVKVSQEIALEISVYMNHLAPAEDPRETEGADR